MSANPPVTEEMVEDFYDAYMNEGGSYQNLRAEKRENERKWIIRGREAAQAVAPPKVSEDGMMAGECCMMAHDRCAAILDDHLTENE